VEPSAVPIYEYQCQKCDTEFELLIRGEQQAVCPSCGNAKLQKLLSIPAASSGSSSCELPVHNTATSGGNCGLPACQGGRCQFE
jgi:putative FmdB family regulatory protein